MTAMGRGGRGRTSASGIASSLSEGDGGSPTAYSEILEADATLEAEFKEEYEFNSFDIEAMNAQYDLSARHLSFDYAKLKDEYSSLWAEMSIRRSRLDEIDQVVERIVSHKARYRSVEQSTRVPWFVIAVLHSLECGGDFARHLHNGDPLTARTVQVPAGRPRSGTPPFTWEESATDALNYDGLTKNSDWSVERIGYLLEGFNGWGYRLYHPEVKSPYLWSYSNHYTSGKYVADGKWSPTAVSKQLGSMVLLKRLEDKGHIQLRRSTTFGSVDDHGNGSVDWPGRGAERNSALSLEMPADATLVPTLIELGLDSAKCAEIRDRAFEAMRKVYGKKTAHNACACTLSMFLRAAGIDIRVEYGAQRLANLIQQRGWKHIAVGEQIAGDVAVTIDGDHNGGADHVFFVVKTLGRDRMLIADNQTSTCPHERFASGKGKTRVDYFLRAPGFRDRLEVHADGTDFGHLEDAEIADGDEDTNTLSVSHWGGGSVS